MMGDIDDCVNTVFVELLSKSGKYDAARGNMEAFVTVVARSAALNYCKSNMHKNKELIGDDKFDFLLSPICYEDEAEFGLLAESIISKLNKQESELFAMRYLYYYPPGEIAVALNIKRSAVDMRLSRLRDKIRKQLIKGGIIL